MNLILTFARRYLFSRKSSNAINIITLVSVLGIAVCSAALILVLSVFNGLTHFIEGLFAAIDPDIKIVAARGQTFADSDSLFEELKSLPGVATLTRTVEGKVWVEYIENQTIATLKGVEQNFSAVNPIDTFVYEGNYTFGQKNGISQVVLGSIVAARLSANLADEARTLTLSYLPQDASLNTPETSIRFAQAFPSGYFSVQKEYDEKFILSDFAFAQELFGLEGQVSAYELRLGDIGDAEKLKAQLQAKLGPDYEVLTWYEQHKTLYRVMKNEKYISYLILALMLLLAAVNIVGSLSMIVLEKTRDIAILKSLGASRRLVRRIFLATGAAVGGLGALIGVLIALAAGLSQQSFGWLKLQGGESFRVKAFPIELQLADFLLVFGTVMLLSSLASIYPSLQAARLQMVKGLRG
jgi:lipoprotein-releasing system permease protein